MSILKTLKKTIFQQNVSLREFAMLLFFSEEDNKGFEEILSSLHKKGLLLKDGQQYVLNNNGKQFIEDVLLENSPTKKKKQERFNILADKLRELYPQGKKEGTSYTWRDNTITIARKLAALDNLYSFTDEEAINATKRYVDSFGSDRRYMQLLKYFILKNNLATGEQTSQLLSYIQNPQEEIQNKGTLEFI